MKQNNLAENDRNTSARRIMAIVSVFLRAIWWFYLMYANKKEKYERALIGALGKLYTNFNIPIFFDFLGYQEQFLGLSRTIFGLSKNNFLYQPIKSLRSFLLKATIVLALSSLSTNKTQKNVLDKPKNCS